MDQYLTDEQIKKASRARSTIGAGAEKVVITGALGTLEHFGFPVDGATTDLASAGKSYSYTRRAYSRTKYLGDATKVAVAGGSVAVKRYPSTRGNAVAGVPITLRNLETGMLWSVHVLGEIGNLIAWFASNRPDFPLQIHGKSGNLYTAPVLESAPSGGGTQTTP